jgi:tetratricopeptide (TPR) repeat protein
MDSTRPNEPASLVFRGSAGNGETRRGNRTRDLSDAVALIGFAVRQTAPAEAARLRRRIGYPPLSVSETLEAFTLMRDGAVEAGDRRLEALAHCGLAAAHDFVGEPRESLEHARTAKRLAKKLDDSRTLAIALNSEAQFHETNGDDERAFTLFKEIEGIARDLNDWQLVMGAQIGLGRTGSKEGSAVGTAHYERAIEIAREMGDHETVALCLTNLSDWKIHTGEYDEALRLREESLRLSQALGLDHLIERALVGRARIHTIQGDLDEPRELLERRIATPDGARMSRPATSPATGTEVLATS